ncbi:MULTISPECIES: L-aspartate oxidase [Rhizobium]|uniref:L-aspartate oxidase n=1 Tax=Rhizobium tropici TaxID=398 RepID=A0A6P1C1C2_RHITR|nr:MULTISPECIES: L-aspartate oxidase [Rhizobium]AGB74457.1 L-aspartate oxidase [Rhizobium tropici CIAT 899]MBB4242806.1 L-aspartate oxidase [Rhizobium tropici]MBB5594289.1 L-aspartate oxidase [Rhizobium tropici]MBB6493131.1 L-aspartate oxidase [Rhizobium tropici]NEV10788.1 L-aspartate oxidase [Rhizobium tropici]
MSEILEELGGRIVVVGSGLAGLMTALTLAPEPTVIVTRALIGAETSSAWAQGGIAASIGEGDSAALHLADTLAAGDGLCDAKVAARIVAEAPAAIAALECFGVEFDRNDAGELSLGLEAAHSFRRIVHSKGDGSGAAIVRALAEAVARTQSITVLEGYQAQRLLLDGDRIAGLLCLTDKGSVVLQSSRMVLATGGIGGLFDATTNPVGNFGQGIALAARAGARLADMEFVQFHPTALDSRRRPLALVSEAVRGEGALLVNESGERFMADVEGAELAPRDVVARAISAQIARGGRVFLDARAALGNRFGSRFPVIEALCNEAGVDPASDLIPVRPAVHYHMGGVATDENGRSSVPGLWVVGEAASTGLHGANRLASNSLLEAAVMGMRAAHDIASSDVSPASLPKHFPETFAPDPALVRPIVSRHLGVLRNGGAIHGAIAALLPFCENESTVTDPALVALLIAVFASLRMESRGAHARTDFPLKLQRAQRRMMHLTDALDIARSVTPYSMARSA